MITTISRRWLRRCVMVLCAVPYAVLLLLLGILITASDTWDDVWDDCKAAWR